MGRSPDCPISPVAIPKRETSALFTGLLAEPLLLDDAGFQELASLRGHPALFMAICDSSLQRDRLIAEVIARLPDWIIFVFKVQSEEFLPWLASDKQAKGDAVFIVVDPEIVSLGARYLNYRREILIQLPCPIVMWFPHNAEEEIHRIAPDFWAFRNQVFTFRLFAPWLLKVSQKVAKTGIPGEVPEEREANIALLQDMEAIGAGKTLLSAHFRHELGVLLCQEGRWAESRQELERSLAILETLRSKDDERAHALFALGVTLYKHDAALASYQAALDLFRQIGARLREANTLASLSRLALAQGQDEKARTFLQEAVDLHAAIAADLDNFGLALRDLGRLEEARPYLLQAAEIFDQIGFPQPAEQVNGGG